MTKDDIIMKLSYFRRCIQDSKENDVMHIGKQLDNICESIKEFEEDIYYFFKGKAK
jgi:hypothetical protein